MKKKIGSVIEMLFETLKIDEIDKKIISILQENPKITHVEIASIVNKSQGAIHRRISNLKKNLISHQVGVNIKKVETSVVKVEIFAKNQPEFYEKILKCPFIFQALKISGLYNLCIFIYGLDHEAIDNMIDNCIRSELNVLKIKTNLIIESIKNMIVPINFDKKYIKDFGCSGYCRKNINNQKTKNFVNQSIDFVIENEIQNLSIK